MVPMTEDFRLGWIAGRGDEDFPPELLDAAWHERCGTADPAPEPYTEAAFVNDWNAMVATISVTCTRYNLRKPDMVFHPQWLRLMRQYSQQHISSTLVHMGVRVKFATFEQATVIREL